MKLTSVVLNDEFKPVAQPDLLDDLQEAWHLLGLTHEQPVIVNVSGASGMSEEDIDC